MKTVLLYASLALALVVRAPADDNASTIKFSDPGKPGTIKIALARGDVRVHGSDSSDVTVKSEIPPRRTAARKDGLRVLTDSTSYSLVEKNNIVTLDAVSDGWSGSPSDFDVTVPKNTAVVVSSAFGGDVICSGVSGDIEIKSLNGEVTLSDVVGAALVETTNGEIRATVREVHPNKTISLTSMNGGVAVRVPADTKANVRLRTQNGSILTDFDEKTLVTKVEAVPGKRRGRTSLAPETRDAIREAARASVEAARHAAEAFQEAADAAREGADGKEHDSIAPKPPKPPVPPVPAIPTMTGGKLVTGTLNGGGPEINVATVNGDITLRSASK